MSGEGGVATPVAEPVEVEDVPRRLTARHSVQDRLFVHGVRTIGLFVLVIVSSIGLFLGLQARPTFSHYGWSFFTESRWLPSQDIVGISAVLLGTLQVAAIAAMNADPW